MTLDLDAIAREAELKMCRALSFPDSAAGTMNRNSPMFAPFFADLLLEKAAQVCEGRRIVGLLSADGSEVPRPGNG